MSYTKPRDLEAGQIRSVTNDLMGKITSLSARARSRMESYSEAVKGIMPIIAKFNEEQKTVVVGFSGSTKTCVKNGDYTPFHTASDIDIWVMMRPRFVLVENKGEQFLEPAREKQIPAAAYAQHLKFCQLVADYLEPDEIRLKLVNLAFMTKGIVRVEVIFRPPPGLCVGPATVALDDAIMGADHKLLISEDMPLYEGQLAFKFNELFTKTSVYSYQITFHDDQFYIAIDAMYDFIYADAHGRLLMMLLRSVCPDRIPGFFLANVVALSLYIYMSDVNASLKTRQPRVVVLFQLMVYSLHIIGSGKYVHWGNMSVKVVEEFFKQFYGTAFTEHVAQCNREAKASINGPNYFNRFFFFMGRMLNMCQGQQVRSFMDTTLPKLAGNGLVGLLADKDTVPVSEFIIPMGFTRFAICFAAVCTKADENFLYAMCNSGSFAAIVFGDISIDGDSRSHLAKRFVTDTPPEVIECTIDSMANVHENLIDWFNGAPLPDGICKLSLVRVDTLMRKFIETVNGDHDAKTPNDRASRPHP